MKDEKYNSPALCSLIDSSSLGEYLAAILGASKNKLKEFYSREALNISIHIRDEIFIPTSLLNLGVIAPVFTGDTEVEVIEEDEHILAISKPAGTHGHPQSYDERETVLNFLRQSRSDIDWDGFNDPEKGLLYRLDRETSGLLLFCKEPSAHSKLRDDFKNQVRQKYYYALVEGELLHRGEFTCDLEAFGPKGAQMRLAQKEGQSATLWIENTQYFPGSNVSLVKVRLATGLRHQIRVQLKILGHPIVGDSLYGGRESARLFLHCFSYTLAQAQKSYQDNRFFLLGDYLGIDSRLQVFGDELLVSKSR